MNLTEQQLLEIYRNALYRSTPTLLTRQGVEQPEVQALLQEPISVICLGKAASSMFKGIASSVPVVEGLAAYPAGYIQDAFPPFVEVVEGSHPAMTDASFEAGEAVLRFADRCGEFQVVVLLSGGTSASMAKPLEPYFNREDLTVVNQVLLHSGLPIEKINTVRKHLSAIKGGRLGEHLPPGTITLVVSDVSRGAWQDVGSGPTLPDSTTNREAAEILQGVEDATCRRLAEILSSGDVPETPKHLNGLRSFLMGDNGTLLNKAGEIAEKAGFTARVVDEELNGDVSDVAKRLREMIKNLTDGEILVAGGEPTVRVSGDGRGGRCSELSVRLGELLRADRVDDVVAILASSDGVDGETGAAGYILTPERYTIAACGDDEVADVLARSDSLSLVEEYAIPIEKRPTGNNLRDLFLITRSNTAG